MTATAGQQVPTGYSSFARYAYPPNALGYCGPADVPRGELGAHAREFDGAWPYLAAIADAAGIADPLDADVVRSYWVGGPLLNRVDPADLLARLRTAFHGQVTGLLDHVTPDNHPLAHHSFHVLVVYPWVRFLDRDPTTAVRVMQDCRTRAATVDSVADGFATITSRPLRFDDGLLSLGEPVSERVRWCDNAPAPGDSVSVHWDWLCAPLSDAEVAALTDATRTTLDLVNGLRRC